MKKKTNFWIWLLVGGWSLKTEISLKMSDSCISISKSQITLFWLLVGICARKWRSQKSSLFFSLNVPTRSSKNGHFESKSMMKMMKISDFHVFFHFSSENRLFRFGKQIQIHWNNKLKSFVSGLEKSDFRVVGENDQSLFLQANSQSKTLHFHFSAFWNPNLDFLVPEKSCRIDLPVAEMISVCINKTRFLADNCSNKKYCFKCAKKHFAWAKISPVETPYVLN